MTSPDSVRNDGSLSQSESNSHTIDLIVSSGHAVQASIYTISGTDSVADPHTDLDSHANMVVLGKHAYIFESTGKTFNVNPFSDDLGIAKDVPIVGGAVYYDCPYTRETYILIIRNALHIPSMENNLIPPFIVMQGGVKVNDIPKIQCLDPSMDDHCISFTQCDIRIPLQLMGIFSYFHTRKLLSPELFDNDKVFITPFPSEWNPNFFSFENN